MARLGNRQAAARGEEGGQGLDALTNPFEFTGRFVGGAVRSVDDILRGLTRAGGAVLSDTVGEVTRGVVPGGDPGFWQEGDISTWEDLVKPVGESFGNTAQLVGEIGSSPRAIWDEEHRERLGDRLQQFNDDPFMFTLEHVGNAAIVGSAVTAPARAGIAAGRSGGSAAGAAARSLRPLAGREARAFGRTRTRQLADEARESGSRFSPEQIADFGGNIVGHPYQALGRKVNQSNLLQGIRSASRPVDTTGDIPGARSGQQLDISAQQTFDPTDVSGDVMPQLRELTQDTTSPMAQTSTRNILDEIPNETMRTGQATENIPTGTSTDPAANIGRMESIGQALGSTLQTVRASEGYQSTFGPAHRNAKKIAEDLRRGIRQGVGRVAESTRNRGDTPWGPQDPMGASNVRMSYSPQFAEQGLVRGMRNLRRQRYADEYPDLIRDLDDMGAIDRVTAASVPGRAARVIGGRRSAGSALSAEDIVNSTSRILDEANRRSGGDPIVREQVIRDIVPDTEPLALELRALNAAEEMQGLPRDSLTGALADTIRLGERTGNLNMQAQRILRGTDYEPSSGTQARFEVPDEHLVKVESLDLQTRQIFDSAFEQHLWNQGSRREMALSERGIIPQAGTRTVRDPETGQVRPQDPSEPSRFAVDELEDLPLTTETRRTLGRTRRESERAQRRLEQSQRRVQELQESGRPLTRTVKSGETRPTPTGDALRRHTEEVARRQQEVNRTAARLNELEEAIRLDPENVPATAREFLTYANNVAPAQARALRQMAEDARQGRVSGQPEIYEQIADELDATPQTLEALDESGYRLGHLRMLEGTSENVPGAARPDLRTNLPGGFRRRGTDTDLYMSRDMRSRLVGQEQEFQSYLMRLEADNWVRDAGLAKSGRQWLREAGLSDEYINGLTNNQALQEFRGIRGQNLRQYDPESIFGFATRPRQVSQNVLDQEFISPYTEQALRSISKDPGKFEKRVIEGMWDPLINNWKVIALPLRPGWQVNNAAGNAVLSMLSGRISPVDYPKILRASQKAVRNWNRGVTDHFRVPLSGKHLGELRARMHQASPEEAAHIQQILDEGAIHFDNATMNDIASGGLTRGNFAFLNDSNFMRDLTGTQQQNIFQQFGADEIVRSYLPDEGSGTLGDRALRTPRNWWRSAKHGTNMAYRANEAVDNFHRAAIYMDQMMQGRSHAEGMAQITKALADYNRLSAFEQRWIKRGYPFYPWMRHMAEVMTSSVHPSNIQRTTVFTHLTNTLGQPNEFEEMLPDWAGGHIYVGETEDGTPEFMSTRGMNPFLDVFDPIQQPHGRGMLRPLAPPLGMAIERTTGIRTLTGGTFSTPGRAYGMTPDELPRPSWGRHIMSQIPQARPFETAWRDITNQPTVSYATGEPIYGLEGQGQSGAQGIAQYAGFNISPLDVESMQEREIQRKYREEVAQKRYEAEAEAHPSRSPVEALQDLPLIPGGS